LAPKIWKWKEDVASRPHMCLKRKAEEAEEATRRCSYCKRLKPQSAFARPTSEPGPSAGFFKVCETCRERQKNYDRRNKRELTDAFFREKQRMRISEAVRKHLRGEEEAHRMRVREIASARNRESTYRDVLQARLGDARWKEVEALAAAGTLQMDHRPRNGVTFADSVKRLSAAVKAGEPHEDLLDDVLHVERLNPVSVQEHKELTKAEQQEKAKGGATFNQQKGRWRAQFTVDYKNRTVGYYCTRAAAAEAAYAALREFRDTGEYTRQPRRARNATEVVEGPRENDWRVYRGKRLMSPSSYATREEAERSLRNDIRKFLN